LAADMLSVKCRLAIAMHVIFLGCKERDALPAASRRPNFHHSRDTYFLENVRMISASVYSGMLEIARA